MQRQVYACWKKTCAKSRSHNKIGKQEVFAKNTANISCLQYPRTDIILLKHPKKFLRIGRQHSCRNLFTSGAREIVWRESIRYWDGSYQDFQRPPAGGGSETSSCFVSVRPDFCVWHCWPHSASDTPGTEFWCSRRLSGVVYAVGPICQVEATAWSSTVSPIV